MNKEVYDSDKIKVKKDGRVAKYSPAFKARVVMWSYLTSAAQATREFGVSRRSISKWANDDKLVKLAMRYMANSLSSELMSGFLVIYKQAFNKLTSDFYETTLKDDLDFLKVIGTHMTTLMKMNIELAPNGDNDGSMSMITKLGNALGISTEDIVAESYEEELEYEPREPSLVQQLGAVVNDYTSETE